MVENISKRYISWEEIDGLIIHLADRIKTEMPYIESIVGIERGGLIPAVMLSHKLGLPLTKSISANTLVVDDICDSGKTLKEGVGVYTAVLFHKPHTSCFTPSIFAEEYKGDDWIILPWENKDSEPIQDYLVEHLNYRNRL